MEKKTCKIEFDIESENVMKKAKIELIKYAFTIYTKRIDISKWLGIPIRTLNSYITRYDELAYLRFKCLAGKGEGYEEMMKRYPNR